MTSEEFLKYCERTYKTKPDCPFRDMSASVFRHRENKKWFAIMRRVSREKFGINSKNKVDVVNLKIPEDMRELFGRECEVYPAYHMNKRHWVSVLLSEASEDIIVLLLDTSHNLTLK